MRTSLALLSIPLASVLALAHAAGPASYGKPVPAGTAIPVSRAIGDFDTHAGKPGLFGGRITQVCQAKGCWMVLEDEGRSARVMFGDHAFAIPKDSSGRARVHGVLSRKALTAAQSKHLEEDGKGLAVAAEEYRILADGVLLEAADR